MPVLYYNKYFIYALYTQYIIYYMYYIFITCVRHLGQSTVLISSLPKSKKKIKIDPYNILHSLKKDFSSDNIL